jgi:hypothetical protein
MKTKWQIFHMPLIVSAISLFGLIATLLTDDLRDLAWTAFAAVPLGVIAVLLARGRLS